MTLRKIFEQAISKKARVEFEQALEMRRRMGMEFPTEEARETYLKEHPKGDPNLHTVKKESPKEKEEKEPKKEKEEGSSQTEKPSKGKPKTHTLPGGTNIRVYDAGEDAGDDRYTVVLDTKDWDSSAKPGYKAIMGLSERGRASEFGESKEGEHLGKGVDFDDLDEATKKRIETDIVGVKNKKLRFRIIPLKSKQARVE